MSDIGTLKGLTCTVFESYWDNGRVDMSSIWVILRQWKGEHVQYLSHIGTLKGLTCTVFKS